MRPRRGHEFSGDRVKYDKIWGTRSNPHAYAGTVTRWAAASLASAGSPPRLGDGVTGVTRQKAEHEGDPPGRFDETHSGYGNA